MTSYVAASDLSVSMAGYNTVCEVLAANVPAIFIPRMDPRREQYIRASRLVSRNSTSMIVPEDLTPESLLTAVLNGLAAPPRSQPSLRLDGGGAVASFLDGLLQSTRPLVSATGGTQ
jgi:predicted glycosyltransferase